MDPLTFAEFRLAPLPVPLTPLVGRKREVDAVASLIGQPDVRLVTVTGTAGVGKTRVAVKTASRLAADFPERIGFVPLAPISDPAHVLPAIAQSLDLKGADERSLGRRLALAFRSSEIVLVLDNFEHVVAAAPHLAELLGEVPTLKLLVTSRSALRVEGEHEFEVEPLPLAEAEELFRDRVRAIRPGLVLTENDVPAIAQICVRLDKLPLAIELAAARGRVLNPTELLARLGDRLGLLGSGHRDAPARQRTMRDAIAWSYDLLFADEQALLRRLSVFVGGFSLEAAESVCGAFDVAHIDVLEGIDALIGQSLLRRDAEGPHGDAPQPRFAMLEMIREFALERLAQCGEGAAVNRAHAVFFTDLAERVAPTHPIGGRQPWLHLLQPDRDNLRAALAWQLAHREREGAMRLSAALLSFWVGIGEMGEGRSWLERALAAWDEDATTLLAFRVRNAAGYLAYWLGDYGGARNHLQRALQNARELGDVDEICFTLLILGGVFEFEGDDATAKEQYTEALNLARTAGDHERVASALRNLGDLAFREGDLVAATDLTIQAIAGYRTLGNGQLLLAMSLAILGAIRLVTDEVTAAADAYRESLNILVFHGFPVGIADTFAGIAWLAVRTGRPMSAARLLGASEALCEALGVPVLPAHRQHALAIAETRANLDAATLEDAWSAGRRLSISEAVDEARLITVPPTSTVTSDPPHGAGDNASHLTRREAEILSLLAAGLTAPEIGSRLSLSDRTVERHTENLYRKIGVHRRAEAVAYALSHGHNGDALPLS